MADRYFTEFAAASEQSVSFPALTITGDYSISVKFYYRDFDVHQMLLGNSADGNTRLWLIEGGNIQWNVGGQAVGTAAPVLGIFNEYDVNEIVVSRTGGNAQVSLNGVVVAGPTAQSNNPTLDRIGRYASNLFWFDGIIFDVDLNGERFYALDDNGVTAVDSVAAQNGSYVGSPSQSLFTETINATVTKYARNDGGLTLFLADTRPFNHLSFLGDSIFGRPLNDADSGVTNVLEQYAALFDSAHDRRVRIWNDGVGSQTISQIEARVPGIITRFAGISNVYVFVETGINDGIIQEPTYGPLWSSLPVGIQNTLIGDLTDIHTDLTAAGHEVAITSTPYAGATFTADTQSYSTGWTVPLCASLTPTWYDSGSSRPILDIETKSKFEFDNNQAAWYDPDLVHYTAATGMPDFKDWMAGIIGPRIAGPSAGTEVTGADTSQAQSSDTVALTENAVVTVIESSQGQLSDTVNLTEHHVITVLDSGQGQGSDTVSLSEGAVLAAQDSEQSQTSDAVQLTENAVLSTADTVQAQSSGGVQLTQHSLLSAVESGQQQTSDAVGLTEHSVLAVGESSQAQASDEAQLTLQGQLQVVDSLQAQGSDPAPLTEHGSIAVLESAQGQFSDATVITEHSLLTVPDSAQGQNSDVVTLVLGNALPVNDSGQSQGSDVVGITQHSVLVAAGSVQGQQSELVALMQNHILAANDSFQSQASDVVVLFLPDLAAPGTRVGLTIKDGVYGINVADRPIQVVVDDLIENVS